VRITWSERLGSDGFDGRFRRVLHDGVGPGDLPAAASPAGGGGAGLIGAGLIEEVADPAAALERAFALAAESAGEGGLEAVFRTSLQVHDGRFANVAWLQELPDPVTKITWDNAALMSPATARDLGVASGEKVRLTLGERSVEAPVFTLPGQADGCVVLPLGYGRTAAGRVGDGVGFSAYQLRGSASPWAEGGLAVEKIGGRHELVQTQEHWRMEGRPIVREATLAHFHEEPDFATKPDEETPPLESLWEEKDYGEGHRWGMTLDLNACIGCNACVVACQSENNVPVVGREQVGRGREMQWLRVDRYFRGGEADPQVVFQPVPCQHCENAPCEQVCPVAATVHDAEGLNVMVYNRCIGTRYCSNNCPYKVRRFNFFNYTKATPELLAMAMNPDVTVRSRGVMEKCTYCLQRISRAKATAKREERPIRDGDVVTACQQTCPAAAIVFGDLNDPESRVGKLKREPRNYELLAELNNKPRTSYLGKIRNPNPQWGVA
jgi:molybdopterin-containing oxidoreductase family iron-sulfur binding subunit